LNWIESETKFGYGRFFANGKEILAHRMMWIFVYGDIPKGMCVCHTCDNPRCVNPAHLFLGTKRDNNIDMFAKGRQRYHYGAKGKKWHDRYIGV